ncbi:MAG TPA: hypothetical protein VFW98_07415 [Gemmatimonadaceae bacterium]|nr:hypothetical protein [Gemmatimonadaceae bacterium]
MAMIACRVCGRQISDQSTRCLYCARPVAPSGEEDAEAEAARQEHLYAMYATGIGMPSARSRGWIQRLREESIAVRLLAVAALTPLLMVVPFRTIRWIQDIFRP